MTIIQSCHWALTIIISWRFNFYITNQVGRTFEISCMFGDHTLCAIIAEKYIILLFQTIISF